jgi:hypothetical protein
MEFYSGFETEPKKKRANKVATKTTEAPSQDNRMYSEELTQLELLIKSQEELKDKGVLTNEGIGYLNGLKTAFNQFKKK